MKEDNPTLSAEDANLQREIIEGRKFSLEEAVARMAGPGAMKGESPVARLYQAEFEIEAWLVKNLIDSSGALQSVLIRHVKGSEILLGNFEQPLAALFSYCKRILESDYLLEELVREADAQWGRLMGERPHFEKKGVSRHPDDPYTVELVRGELQKVCEQLKS